MHSPLPHFAPLLTAADNAMRMGNHREAARLLEELTSTGAEDSGIYLRLAVARRSLGDLSGALKAACVATEIEPTNFLALLMRASLYESFGSYDLAVRTSRAALRHAPDEANIPPQVRDQLRRARDRLAADEEWQQAAASWQPPFPAALAGSPDSVRRIEGFHRNMLGVAEADHTDEVKFVIPDLPTREFFDPEDFIGVPELEAATEVVRNEFLSLMEIRGRKLTGHLHGDAGAVAEDGRPSSGAWSMMHLIRDGTPIEENASLCPETMRLYSALCTPELGLISPSLNFSLLDPHTRISPHTGVTNARVVMHLPLFIPENCGLRVGHTAREWVVGQALVFDDMIEHEAWNDSDQLRVVLIADLWHPELTAPEREAVSKLMTRRRA